MHITIKYFASIREAIGTDTEVFVANESVKTVSDVMNALVARSETYAAAMANPRLKTALNQKMCSVQTLIAAGDELAFFPPVTGG